VGSNLPGFYIPIVDECKEDVPQGGPPHTVETARTNRYTLEVLEPLGTKTTGVLLFLAKCSRPSVEIDQIAFHAAQDEIFRPGKHHWKAVEFTFYEKLDGSVDDDGKGDLTDQPAKMIYEWWAKTMINLDTGLHNDPSTYLKNCQLNLEDGFGDPIWEYHLYDCWPAMVSPSELTYSDSNIAEITVTLRYSKVKEKKEKKKAQ
jgi:hypothetical protein